MGKAYLKALSGFDPSDQERIEKFLARWERSSVKGARVAINIQRESFLEEGAMREVLQVILKEGGNGVKELEAAYEQACYQHSLKGKRIQKAHYPELVGRAVPLDQFLAMMVNKYNLSQEKAEDLIDALESGDLDTVQQEMDMTNFGAWVTWSDVEEEENPFYYVEEPFAILRICANLGLSHGQENLEHIIFMYDTHQNLELRYPTIADGALYDYFKPAGPNEEHGWTLPRNFDELVRKGIQDDVKPRPEAIHPRQKLSILTKPIQTW